MQPKKKQTTHFPLHGISTFVSCNGLDEYLKTLERDFFAEIDAQCRFNIEKEETDLLLNIHCNFGLTESLHEFNNGNWGGISPEAKPFFNSKFQNTFQKLCMENDRAIDISELSFHFKDTSIIISRIKDYNISEEFEGILRKISEHFVYFTKGLTKMPYEIFVPVFEDVNQHALQAKKQRNLYYDFWGLYFDDEVNHNIMIYNLDKKEMTEEKFFLLD